MSFYISKDSDMSLKVFRKGIDDDIAELRADDSRGIFDSCSEDYVFNGVMLMRDFGMDNSDFEEHIVDGSNDCGVDTWAYDEYRNVLYLVQNKLYGDTSSMATGYVEHALNEAYDMLERGEYRRCQSLQDVFDAHRNDEGFVICHRFNVTKPNVMSDGIRNVITKFNSANAPRRYCEFRDLGEMMECYYSQPYTLRHKMDHEFHLSGRKERGGYIASTQSCVQEGNSVEIHKFLADVSVTALFELFENANASGYNLFEENVREYLGTRTSVNKEIRKTLESETERKMFGAYNNGITITCKSMELSKKGLGLIVHCPQVVNGCQTLSTIYDVLRRAKDDDERTRMFGDVTVSVTFFMISSDSTDAVRSTVGNIIIARNQQNSIKMPLLSAINDTPAMRYKVALAKYGIALCVKQSDSNRIRSAMNGELAKYRARFIDSGLAEKWGLLCKDNPRKLCVSDRSLVFSYEKLLQIVCMTDFEKYAPYSKAGLLSIDSDRSRRITEIIVNQLTPRHVANLIAAYMKIEATKKKRKGAHNHANWFPDPYRTLTGLTMFECDGDLSKIGDIVTHAEDADFLMDVYGRVCDKEFQTYLRDAGSGENNYTKYMKATYFDRDTFAEHYSDAREVEEGIRQGIAEKTAVSAEASVTCVHCHALVGKDDRFCSSCGQPIDKVLNS